MFNIASVTILLLVNNVRVKILDMALSSILCFLILMIFEVLGHLFNTASEIFIFSLLLIQVIFHDFDELIDFLSLSVLIDDRQSDRFWLLQQFILLRLLLLLLNLLLVVTFDMSLWGLMIDLIIMFFTLAYFVDQLLTLLIQFT